MPAFTPEACHQPLLQRSSPGLIGKFRAALGQMPARVPLRVRVEWERQRRGYLERRFTFTAEANAEVPCHLLLPARRPAPVVICLQGHTTGMHVSLGRGDCSGDRDFALQAVREGYAALALEQRCFGERADRRPKNLRHYSGTCHHASLTALLLGRTMAGERVWDVMRAIDALAKFPDVDTTRIACMGNSGGGLISYYAACVDTRIKMVMPSCSICTYRDSIGSIDHCADNYLPGALQWFDMPDLAALIAPRPLLIVAGQHDDIFPIRAVRAAYRRMRAVHPHCRLIVGPQGHRFYAKLAWPVFRRMAGWDWGCRVSVPVRPRRGESIRPGG